MKMPLNVRVAFSGPDCRFYWADFGPELDEFIKINLYVQFSKQKTVVRYWKQ